MTVRKAPHRGGIPIYFIKTVGYGEDQIAVVTAGELHKAGNRPIENAIK